MPHTSQVTVLTYISWPQDPTARKFQTIKLTNTVLRQQILSCRGGLELLLFGPAAFHLHEEGEALVLQSAAAYLLTQDRSGAFRRRYESWLGRYGDVLSAVMAT